VLAKREADELHMLTVNAIRGAVIAACVIALAGFLLFTGPGDHLLRLAINTYWDYQRDEINRRPTVDVSFSLTCKVIESADGRPLLLTADAFNEIENDFFYSDQRRWGELGIKYYDKDATIAFNHGVGDGQSHWAIGHMRVVEATPEAITLGGHAWHEKRATGMFNRRTGYGEIRYYDKSDVVPSKQFLFQCNPSKPAKF
jgi:hypothetical protein